MRTFTLLLFAALLLVPAIAVAQDGEPGMGGETQPAPSPDDDRGPFFRPPPERGPGFQPGRPNNRDRRGPSREERMEQMLDRAVEMLGLEGEEAEKFRAVMREAEQSRQQAQEELRAKLQAIREKQAEALRGTLTPEQLEQLQRVMRGLERGMRGGRGMTDARPQRPDPRQAFNRLAEELGLEAQQRQQVERIFRSLDEARQELFNAARSGEIPREQVQEQLQRAQEAVDEQLRQVLTPEQFDKLKEAMPSGGFGGLGDRGRSRSGRPGFGQQGPDPRERLREAGVDDETLGKLEELATAFRDDIRQRIRGAMQSGASPEAVREQLAEGQAALDEQVRELLNEEQFAVWKELSQQFLRRGFRRGGNRGGFRPPNRPDAPRDPNAPDDRPDAPGDRPGSDDGNGMGDDPGSDDGNMMGDDF